MGRKLLRVSDVMHGPEVLPLCRPDTAMSEAILIMTQGTFGCVGITDDKLNFHSLRHTFIDALRNQALVEEPVIKSIIGHSSGNVTGRYGAGHSIDVRYDAVSR